jgi:hypothetical protein
MKKLYTSLQSLHRCLQSNRINYAVIGGLAVAVWGEPRLTQDIDVKVMLSRDEAERLLNTIEGEYKPFGDNPLERFYLCYVPTSELVLTTRDFSQFLV